MSEATWSTVSEATKNFIEILNEPPKHLSDFRFTLTRSLKNDSFRNEMLNCGALLNWDDENKVLRPQWTEETIKASLKAILKFHSQVLALNNNDSKTSQKIKSGTNRPSTISILRGNFEEHQESNETTDDDRRTKNILLPKFRYPPDKTENRSIYQKEAPLLLLETGYQGNQRKESILLPSKPPLSPKPNNKSGKSKNIYRQTQVSLRPEWHPLIGKYLKFIEPIHFIMINDIINKPVFTNQDTQLLRPILPFILQKIKMWNSKFLTAESLYQFIPICEDDTIWKDDEIEEDECNSNEQVLNRLDILSLLAACTETTVLSDIFQNISKFPIALPIILPNPKLNSQTKMLMVTPALENCLIKWEDTEKKNRENYLFKNPYKLITAIRVGNSESVGKSTFLNQIFRQSNIFQCKGQPGNGTPIGLNGCVEFIWMTKDTCKDTIWSAVQTEVDGDAKNEIALLANVHGDALQNEATILAMNSITWKYIVFVMPEELIENYKEKLENLCGKENFLFVFVDPTVAVKSQKTLKTNLIFDNNATVNTLKVYIKQALKTGKIISTEFPISNLIEKIPVHCIKESKDFLELVNQINDSVGYIGNQLTLQKVTNGSPEQYWQIYKQSPYLLELIGKISKILHAPLPERRLGLLHIDQELLILSEKKMAGFSDRLAEIISARNRIFDSDLQRIQRNEELSKINEEFEKSISLNDFLRELSIAFEITGIYGSPAEKSIFSKLPSLYADLLIEGRTLEILDGDIGSVPGIWMEAVCHEVCQKLGPLKVFVVSILGLQSSGKSTLLNALFGCKFATSVGKCTKGLYMRLMILEESFKIELGLDAILVIDTEGLGSPESMLDPNSESKDRTMATFAMTISNLTLINVAGESNKEMVDILQIVILTISRMEKTDLSPDLLLVQQVPEGGHEALLAKGVDNFCKALEHAVEIIKGHKINLGVRTVKIFKRLKDRLKKREILYLLRPFKSGASPQSPPTEEYCQDVLDLRKRIINEYNSKKRHISFCTWHKLLKGYWQAVQTESFALKFKSIRQVQEFIEVNARMATVKTHLDMAFQYHRSYLDDYLNDKLEQLNEQTAVNENFETKILEQINSEIDLLPGQCNSPNHNSGTSCQWCIEAKVSEKILLEYVGQTSSVSLNDTEANLNGCVTELRNISKIHIHRRFESLKIKHGKASECDKILKKIMKDSNETFQTVDEVWNELQSTVQQKYPVRFKKERVINDIVGSYRHIPDIEKWKAHFEKMTFSPDDPKPFLAATKAKKKHFLVELITKPDLNLTANEHNWLCDKIREISDDIVANRRKTQSGYADILVFEHKKCIEDVLKKFEKKFKASLRIQFKYDAIFYSLKLFLEYVLLLQDEWNWQFEVFYLLLKQKQEYLKKIDMYLATQSPMKIQKQAISIAKQLLRAAQVVCMSSLDITNRFEKWATKAEGIRIRYLISMAEELRHGRVDVVLEHFKDPEATLSKWYIKVIEVAMDDILVPELKEIFIRECAEISREIVNLKTTTELETFVNWYLNKVSESLAVEKISDNMLERLKVEIQKNISKMEPECSDEIKTENLPIDYENFWNKMGCTATCPRCAAVCWGARDHEHGLAIYKRHFTCHQPKGLAGVVNESTGLLEFKSCSHYEEENDEDSAENSSTYIDAMENEDDWLYKSLPVDEYSQLMQWFFLKLNKRLSEQFNAQLPNDDVEAKTQLSFLETRLDTILNFIKHKSDL